MAVVGSLEDTIVARATPAGEGAIAIVRLSGPLAREVATRVAPSCKQRRSHRLCHARLRAADGSVIDEGLVVEMHAPRSYTGEDVVEFQVHGARIVVERLLSACREHGARLAEPGEFTLRAFLHGRLDLAQAEAVADLIAAESEAQSRVATAHLAGGLSRLVGELLAELEAVLADWQAVLDFPEQMQAEAPSPRHLERLAQVGGRIQVIIAGARLGLRRGRHLVLCGAPNVGKSSLVNLWLGERRVLVDDRPGTTRDPVEVQVTAGADKWSVWDTAGIRAGASGLELQGQELALERMRRADLVLWLVTAEAPSWPPEGLASGVVGAKADVASPAARAAVECEAKSHQLSFWGWVSAHSGEGVQALRERLASREALPQDASAIVVRERHVAALQRALVELERVQAAHAQGAVLDLLASDLERAAKALGEIPGRDVDAEVLDQIFSQFCLGK